MQNPRFITPIKIGTRISAGFVLLLLLLLLVVARGRPSPTRVRRGPCRSAPRGGDMVFAAATWGVTRHAATCLAAAKESCNTDSTDFTE